MSIALLRCVYVFVFGSLEDALALPHAANDRYTSWLSEKQKQKELERRLKLLEAEKADLDQCTFKPQIHEAPAYVKRIAESMRLAKAARPKPTKPARPDWR